MARIGTFNSTTRIIEAQTYSMSKANEEVRVIALPAEDLHRLVPLRTASGVEAGERLGAGWEDRFVAYFRDRQQLGLSQAFAATTRQEIAGMAFASLVEDYRAYAFGQRSGCVNAVYVCPPCRRRGIATQLMGAAIGWLTEKRCTLVRLRPSEAAQQLYRSFGFTSSGELQLELRIGGDATR